MTTNDQRIVAMVGSLVTTLPDEPSLSVRSDVVVIATHALVRLGRVQDAHQVFEAAFSTLAVKTWKPDNLTDQLLPGDMLENLLESTCHLIVGFGRMDNQTMLVERLITKATAIIQRLRTKKEGNEHLTTSCIWNLLQALARIGRLDAALRQVPATEKQGFDEYEQVSLPAAAWKSGFIPAADAAISHLLQRRPALRFSLATSRLAVGDEQGAQALIVPMTDQWKRVYAEHVVSRFADQGLFEQAFKHRSACRHGARSCAEQLAGNAATHQRWDVLRHIVAEELAADHKNERMDDLHWVLLRARAGDDAPLLHHVEDPAGDSQANVHWLVHYAVHLRSQGKVTGALPRLASAALRLALSDVAERSFAYEEYGMCLATAIAAQDREATRRIWEHVSQMKEWWQSNLEACCTFLATLGTVKLALHFIEENQAFLTQPEAGEASHRFLKPVVRLLAAMGDHEGTSRACALVPGVAGRNEMYAAILMGMSLQQKKKFEPSHWRDLADGL